MRRLLVGLLAAVSMVVVTVPARPAAADHGHAERDAGVTTSAAARRLHLDIRAVAFLMGPTGTRISVVQLCPAGTRLNRRLTLVEARGSDATLAGSAPGARVVSRELWPAGLVTRYRLTRAVDFGFNNLDAVCDATVPVGTRHLRGQLTLDVRVWGPAATGLPVESNIIMPGIRPGPPSLEGSLQPAGTGASRGALPDGLTDVTQYAFLHEDQGVYAGGRTARTVPPGRFVSLVNAARYDLPLP